MLLGALGDRFGRRGVFLFSLTAISASTVAMGLLPGYASWGFAATALMVALRLLQGLCLGGELPCAIVYVVETAPQRAGFACGILFFCVNSGVSLAALVSLGLNSLLPPGAAADIGWRIAFAIGGLTGLLSYALRRKLSESEEFAAMRAVASRTPLRELLRSYPMEVLVGIGTSAATSVFNGMLFAYMPAYLVRALHYDVKAASLAQNVGLAVTSVGLVGVAWLGDRLPRRTLSRPRGRPAGSAQRSVLPRPDRPQHRRRAAVRAGWTRGVADQRHLRDGAGRPLPDPGPIQRRRGGV